MLVCCYNNKGGVGKTTLASAIGFRAFELNISLTLIDLDKQDCTMKWISGDNWDGSESYQKGSVYVTKNIEDVYENSNLTVVDAPPEFDFVEKIDKVDVWVVPVKGRFSLDGASNVLSNLRALKRGNERVVFVSNMTEVNTEIGAKQIKEAQSLGVELFKYPIHRHLSFDKAEDLCCPVWRVPYSLRSASVQALNMFSNWVIKGCPERSTWGETINPDEHDTKFKTNKRLSHYEVK
jgi:cellulose biosynthesis protein BcsQ